LGNLSCKSRTTAKIVNTTVKWYQNKEREIELDRENFQRKMEKIVGS
jgi:hypothetical protein